MTKTELTSPRLPGANRPPRRVLILFSDTGGGHRSAAEALIEAWNADYPGRVQPDMVDFFHYYAPFPFNQAGAAYPRWVKYFSSLYAAVFRGSDTTRRATAIARTVYPYVRRSLRRMMSRHPADVVVSVHPLPNHMINWTMRGMGIHRPYVTVVTDLLTVHAFWYYPNVARIITPTEGARERGMRYGVPAGRITVRGLPVARKYTEFSKGGLSRAEVRAGLGLKPERRVVLLVGGGEGMGPVYETACAIDEALAGQQEPVQLIVVAGRNEKLRADLQERPWSVDVRVEGFVTNMPEWMAAADVLVTKAGPGTITEGLIAGLPLILMSKVPGQEDGNVDYVVGERVGVWAPHPEQVAEQLREWLRPGNPALAAMSARACNIAQPNAASDIAGDILEVADRWEEGTLP